MTPWAIETETAVEVRAAPGKGVADDVAAVISRRPACVVGVVCDGVTGSEGGGGSAAELAVASTAELPWPGVTTACDCERRLLEGIEHAQAAVWSAKRGARSAAASGGGTTTCTIGALYAAEGRCYAAVAWVGDSPAAIVGPHGVRAITPREMDAGAAAPPALGARERVSPSSRTFEVRAGEALLLHSDGFVLDESECQRIYSNCITGGHGWQKFLEQAMSASRVSDDDKSAVVIGLLGEPRQEMTMREDDTTQGAARSRPQRGPAGAVMALAVVLGLLAAGVLGFVAGRQRATSEVLNTLRAATASRGVRGAGQQFVVGSDGAIIPVAALLGTDDATRPQSYRTYKLVKEDNGLAVRSVGTLVVSRATRGETQKLAFLPPASGMRAYLDGARIDENPSVALRSTEEHSVAFYASDGKSSGYRVVPKGDHLLVVPVTPGPEPVQ